MESLCLNFARKVALAGLTCTFAFCGSMVGLVSGALKGQTTETGILRGAGIGAIAGALVSVDFLESCLRGEVLPKLAIFHSLIDGKIFREWVSPALLKAYQWQVNAADQVSYREISDILDLTGDEGLLPNAIEELPTFKISSDDDQASDPCGRRTICCAVCLQDLVKGDNARLMPVCRHIFHVVCIDMWLVKHSSCPTCRQEVL
ncbi:NEP1-interacting protein 1-like [Zingiber officinale]|uniref:NEP1-interacting protein 1-like n=1 Tax=Zingiber officinale TaxID=94328 RepID=UPI001C4D17EB|nr:NEP1-interacting protein 1-like [Zingiber officinale]